MNTIVIQTHVEDVVENNDGGADHVENQILITKELVEHAIQLMILDMDKEVELTPVERNYATDLKLACERYVRLFQ